MTVGAAKTLSSFSSPPPSPLASSEPSALSKSGPKPGETKEQYEQRVLAEALARDPGYGQEIRRAVPVEQPNFTVVLVDGWIMVYRGYGVELLGNIETQVFADYLGRPLPVTRDDRRHIALNAVAAWVTGDGRYRGREHFVNPNTKIVTVEEAGQGLIPTLTVERGVGFGILRDTPPTTDMYYAEIKMIDAKAMAQAVQPVI
jgi:hypothetical protein